MPSVAAISSTVARRRRATLPKCCRSRLFAVLRDAGAVVEQALGDAAFHQELVVAVGEAMRFVADALEHLQRAAVRAAEAAAAGAPGR